MKRAREEEPRGIQAGESNGSSGPKLTKQQKRDRKRAEKQSQNVKQIPPEKQQSLGVSLYKRPAKLPTIPTVLPKQLDRFLVPSDASFREVMRAAYHQYSSADSACFSQEFHTKFQRSLVGLQERGLYQYDVTQPSGLGGKLAKTFVTRCLVGQPGITYKYLGLRMFSFPWLEGEVGTNDDFITIGKLNRELSVKTESYLTSSDCGSAKYNLTLINRCEKNDDTLKKEPTFGRDNITVSWHADSSLKPFSSIAVYHFCPGNEQDDSWKIALRVKINAEGPQAGKQHSAKDELEEKIPPVAIPLPSGTTYFLLDEFNHHHQHCVLAGKCGRYASTHRVSKEEGHTYHSIRDRVLSAIRAGKNLNERTIRLQQVCAAELEFEWIRQFFIQGQSHHDSHIWWSRNDGPIQEFLQLWRNLEEITLNQVQILIEYSSLINPLQEQSKEKRKKDAKKRRHATEVTLSSFDNMILHLKDKATKRKHWHERESDSIFTTLPKMQRPMTVPFPTLDHPLSHDTLDSIIEKLERESSTII